MANRTGRLLLGLTAIIPLCCLTLIGISAVAQETQDYLAGPTATPTATATLTPSATPTATPSPTPSATPSPTETPSPTLSPANRLPFTLEGNLIVVQVGFNDAADPLRMILDTGASRTIIDRDSAARVGLRVPATGPTITLSGISGNLRARLTTADSVTLGGSRLTNRQVAVADDNIFGDPSLAGLLGGDILRAYEVTIDYNGRQVTLRER